MHNKLTLGQRFGRRAVVFHGADEPFRRVYGREHGNCRHHTQRDPQETFGRQDEIHLTDLQQNTTFNIHLVF